jgi:hypothetical protein
MGARIGYVLRHLRQEVRRIEHLEFARGTGQQCLRIRAVVGVEAGALRTLEEHLGLPSGGMVRVNDRVSDREVTPAPA